MSVMNSFEDDVLDLLRDENHKTSDGIQRVSPTRMEELRAKHHCLFREISETLHHLACEHDIRYVIQNYDDDGGEPE